LKNAKNKNGMGSKARVLQVELPATAKKVWEKEKERR